MTDVSPPPPPIRATAPCPLCGGTLTVRRCKTAHRRKLICDCGYTQALPEALKLRLAGMPELWDLLKEQHNDV